MSPILQSFPKCLSHVLWVVQNSQKFRKSRKSTSLLLHLLPTSYMSRGYFKAPTDLMVYRKVSNDMKERALYLLLEVGWEIERIAEALGVLAWSIGRWEENYALHGCVKPLKSIKGHPVEKRVVAVQTAICSRNNQTQKWHKEYRLWAQMV